MPTKPTLFRHNNVPKNLRSKPRPNILYSISSRRTLRLKINGGRPSEINADTRQSKYVISVNRYVQDAAGRTREWLALKRKKSAGDRHGAIEAIVPMTAPTGLTNAAMAGYLSCLVMRQVPRHAAPGPFPAGDDARRPAELLKMETTRMRRS